MDALTQAITAASNGSSFLSKVIIGVTIVGTIIAALQWFSAHNNDYDFTQYSDKQLKCIIGLTKSQNETMIDAAIELCSRRFQ